MGYISGQRASLVFGTLLLIAGLSGSNAQQIYKYVDENGRTVYTDKPIGDEIHIQANMGRPNARSVPAPKRNPTAIGPGAPEIGYDAAGFNPTPTPAVDPTSQKSQGDTSGFSSATASKGPSAVGGGGGGGGQSGGGGLASPPANANTVMPAAAVAQPSIAAVPQAGVSQPTAAVAVSDVVVPSRVSTVPVTTSPSAPPLVSTDPATLQFLSSADFGAGRFRGFQLGNTRNPTRPPDSYFTNLVANGANLGRVWIEFRRCKGCDQYTLDDAQIANMDFYVSKARALGFWIVFLATTAGSDERAGDLWSNPELQKSVVALWKFIAARYKDMPEIAGYDLLNEPIVTWEDKASSRLVWFNLSTDITSAIRSVDPKRVVIVEPTPGGEAYAFIGLQPISDSNVVYSLHMYQPLQITHQGVADMYPLTGIPYPSPATSSVGVWDKAKLSEVLEPVRTFSKKTGIPIFVGEFACARQAPSGSRERYFSDLASLFEAEKWSWTYQAWRSWPGWDPENVATQPTVMAFKRDSNSQLMIMLRSYYKLNH